MAKNPDYLNNAQIRMLEIIRDFYEENGRDIDFPEFHKIFCKKVQKRSTNALRFSVKLLSRRGLIHKADNVLNKGRLRRRLQLTEKAKERFSGLIGS